MHAHLSTVTKTPGKCTGKQLCMFTRLLSALLCQRTHTHVHTLLSSLPEFTQFPMDAHAGTALLLVHAC